MAEKPVFVRDFSKDIAQTYTDGRLNAPAYHRNQAAIRDILRARLGAHEGHAIEIGSGTGQHVVGFASDLPQLTWWPSDPNDNHRRSIEAWRLSAALENVMAPVVIDAAGEDWAFGEAGRPPADDIAAIVCLNVIHIAPWQVAEGLLRGAARHLGEGGHLFLYGPYSKGGVHTAESNARFDESLRTQNPEWGVRDLGEVERCASGAGLVLNEILDMPANNFTLVFSLA